MSGSMDKQILNHSLAIHKPYKEAALINPIALAYMGDAVYELLVRQYVLSLPNHKANHMHKAATSIVSAKAQRATLERLLPHLTEEEQDIVKRGRNAKSGSAPKNADMIDYRYATALECLIGYLYFENRLDRITELFKIGLSQP